MTYDTRLSSLVRASDFRDRFLTKKPERDLARGAPLFRGGSRSPRSYCASSSVMPDRASAHSESPRNFSRNFFPFLSCRGGTRTEDEEQVLYIVQIPRRVKRFFSSCGISSLATSCSLAARERDSIPARAERNLFFFSAIWHHTSMRRSRHDGTESYRRRNARARTHTYTHTHLSRARLFRTPFAYIITPSCVSKRRSNLGGVRQNFQVTTRRFSFSVAPRFRTDTDRSWRYLDGSESMI